MSLFKYLDPDRTDVLRDAKIRFSSPVVLNDPFELQPHIAGFAPPEWIDTQLTRSLPEVVEESYSKVPPELRPVLTKEALTTFCEGLVPIARRLAGERLQLIVPAVRDLLKQKFDQLIGILCLTESPTDLLM
jgi:hypothetical protein